MAPVLPLRSTVRNSTQPRLFLSGGEMKWIACGHK